MTSEFLYTLADVSQFEGLFKGAFLKGHREPRIALVGRSNVGKSTLINALLGARLAQTSKQPGKTRAIHFYFWHAAKKIVADLPGFGYARASQTERARWEQFIEPYFQQDENLERAIFLLDSRHGPTEVDLEAIKFLRFSNIPVTFVFTKVDALKTQSMRALRLKEVGTLFKKLGLEHEPLFWVSSHEKTGLKQLAQSLSMKTDVE